MYQFCTLAFAANPLAHVDAALNATSTVLLLLGLYFIKRGRVEAHKRMMLSAFAVSVIFLCCYLYYHIVFGRVDFTHEGVVRYVYRAMLLTHVVLAATVPFLAVAAIYFGLRATGCCQTEVHDAAALVEAAGYRERHIRLVRWVYPIWLYVSVTGVIVYVMLYHLWPPA